MNNLKVFICLVLLSLFAIPQQLSAQTKKKSASLEIMLSDNAALQVVVNGRIFNVINKRIVLKDIPAKNNHIEVIRKCDRAQVANCRDQVVFSGKVRFEKGKHYQAVVLVGEQQMTVSDKLNLFPSVVFPNNTTTASLPVERAASQPIEQTEFINIVTLKAQMPADVLALGESMKAASGDVDKMKLAEKFVQQRDKSTTVDELQVITSWIMFDENKLTFLKSAYPLVQNPEAYYQLQQAFTMKEYSDQLLDFIQ